MSFFDLLLVLLGILITYKIITTLLKKRNCPACSGKRTLKKYPYTVGKHFKPSYYYACRKCDFWTP